MTKASIRTAQAGYLLAATKGKQHPPAQSWAPPWATKRKRAKRR